MIDLHTHSCFSDGTDTPEELVIKAEQQGLAALALTDHDTLDGLETFLSAGARSSVQTVPGVELSAEAGKTVLHMLGYLFDPADPALQKALKWVQEGREERNRQMLENLNRLGYHLTNEDVRRHAGDKLIGRPHFAAALIEKGHFKHRHKIFQQLLGKGKAAYAERSRLEPEACIEQIIRAGGVAVLAHPGMTLLSVRGLRRLVKKLKNSGLGGLEVWHSSHKAHQTATFLRICADFDLVAVGGSDYHGALTPDITLGRGYGNLSIPDTVLEQLRVRSGTFAQSNRS